MTKVQFVLMDATYKIVGGKAIIYLYGRTPSGDHIAVADSSFEPYFFVLPKTPSTDLKSKLLTLKIVEKDTEYRVAKVTEVTKKFNGAERLFYKITVNVPQAVPQIVKLIQVGEEVEGVFEYDILFVRRYLIDNQFTPFSLFEVEGEMIAEHSRVPVFDAKTIEQIGDYDGDFNILALDIETYNPQGKTIDKENNPIIMIGLYGKDSDGKEYKKVFTWKEFPTKEPYIEFVKSESDMIQRFKQAVLDLKPDIICGYYSDGFDWPYILHRAKKYRIAMDLSWDHESPDIGRGKNSSIEFRGLVHLDILPFIRRVIGRSMETDIFTLDAVAEELIGDRKKGIDIEQLSIHWDSTSEMLSEYAEYNLHDCYLTFTICQKVFPNLIEIVKIVGLLPFDICRTSFSQLVEWFLMRKAAPENIVAPNKPSYTEASRRIRLRAKGAFVFEPKPGLYKDLVVFDFRSLYPSILSTHNISPDMMNCSCCSGKELVPIEGKPLWFCKLRTGFLPGVINELISRRGRIKELLRQNPKDTLLRARSEAVKVLSNSFYGYLGFAQARWYSFECVESITGWGRKYITTVIEKARSQGYEVVYSDTDSIFLVLGTRSREDIMRFLEEINYSLPGILELDLEGFYPSGLFVSMKAAETGAKKKYALVSESGDIKIRGFETVRRNSSIIAKEVQRSVLNIVLKEHNPAKAAAFVKQTIEDLKSHAIDVSKTVITTQIQKDIDSYDSYGPNVAAAQRMEQLGYTVGPGTPLKFVIVGGAGKIRDKVRLFIEVKGNEYDSDYYINNQILPAVERIFAIFNITQEDLLETKKQTTLGNFGA